MNKLLCLIATLVACHTDVFAQQRDSYHLLWKISKPGTAETGYLFGTMHLNWREAYDMSDSVLLALDECVVAAFETDLDSASKMLSNYMNSPSSLTHNYAWTQSKNEVMDQIYADHDYLNAVSGKEKTELREEAFFDASSPYTQFLDYYLFSRAKSRNMNVIGLEWTANHMKGLVKYDTLNYAAMLSDSALYNDFKKRFIIQSKYRNDFTMQKLVDTYWQGNIDSIRVMMGNLGAAGQTDMFGINGRNVVMTSRILELLKYGKLFCAVGAGHLAGDKGIIAMLLKEGYSVKPVKATFTGVAAMLMQEKVSTRSWIEVKDDELGLRLEMPSKPELLARANAMVTIDLGAMRAYGYTADAFFPEKNSSKQLETHALDWMKKNGLEPTGKTKILDFNQGTAIEVTCTQRQADAINRFYHKGDTLYRMFVTAQSGANLSNEDTEYFFNSITFYEANKKSQLTNAKTVTFENYGFSVDVAGTPNEVSAMQEFSYTLENDLKRIKFTDTPRGFNYELRVHLPKAGMFNTAETELQDFTTMSDIVVELTKEQNFTWQIKDSTFKGMHCLEMVGENKTTATGLRMLYRGGIMYMLVADAPLPAKAEVRRFFDSFHPLPLREEDYETMDSEPAWFRIPMPRRDEEEAQFSMSSYSLPVIESRNYVGLDKKSGQSYLAYHFVVDSLVSTKHEDLVQLCSYAMQDFVLSYCDSITEIADLTSYSKRITGVSHETKNNFIGSFLVTDKDIFVLFSSCTEESAKLPQVSAWIAQPFGEATHSAPNFERFDWDQYYTRFKNAKEEDGFLMYQSAAFMIPEDFSYERIDSLLMIQVKDSLVEADLIYLLGDILYEKDAQRFLTSLSNKFFRSNLYYTRAAALYEVASKQTANSSMTLFSLLPNMQTDVDLNPIYEFYVVDSLKYVHPFMHAFQVMLPSYGYLYNDLAYIISSEENRETLDVLLHPRIIEHLVTYSKNLRRSWLADGDEMTDNYFAINDLRMVANSLRKASNYENAKEELLSYLNGLYSEEAQLEALKYAVENLDEKMLPMESIKLLAENEEYTASVVEVFQQNGKLKLLSKKIANQQAMCTNYLNRLNIEGFDANCEFFFKESVSYNGNEYDFLVYQYTEEPTNYSLCGPFLKGGPIVTNLDENNIQLANLEAVTKKEILPVAKDIMLTMLKEQH